MSPLLPPELILQILSYHKRDARNLLSFRLVNSTFDALARAPELWEDRAAEWRRGSVVFNREMMRSLAYTYCMGRGLIDNVVHEWVRALSVDVKNRLPKIGELRNIGLAALDLLEKLRATVEEDDPQQWLSKRYWAKQAWDTILRDDARETWSRIGVEYGQGWEDPSSFEDGLLAFAAFRGVDKIELMDRYEAVMPTFIVACSPALEMEDRTNRFTFVARTVVDTMRTIGIRPARGSEYHMLDNHFLNSVWARTDEGDAPSTAGTLPMSLVSIFTSIIRRLPAEYNVQARGVGFPGTLLAALAEADAEAGSESWLHFNVFANTRIAEADFPALLRAQGMPSDAGDAWRAYIVPSHAAELVTRTGQNIINSVRARDASPEDMSSALYATANASYILSSRQRSLYASWLVSLVQSEYSHDVGWLETVAVETFQSDEARLTEVLELCALIRSEDAAEPVVKDRSPIIVWRCGHVFVHRLFGYVAVIRGWDTTCLASEQWIVNMRVDSLPYGRHQPFYHVICEDGSRRYVASENVTTDPVDEESFNALVALADIGEYFRCTETSSTGRRGFVMSERLKAQYKYD